MICATAAFWHRTEPAPTPARRRPSAPIQSTRTAQTMCAYSTPVARPERLLVVKARQHEGQAPSPGVGPPLTPRRVRAGVGRAMAEKPQDQRARPAARSSVRSETRGDDDYSQVSGAPSGVAFDAVSAGYHHTCGLQRSHGEVVCWGSD